MQIRRAFSIGISLLLLCVPSFASMCDLNCSLPHSVPKLVKHDSTMQPVEPAASMAHSHCGHAAMRHADSSGAKYACEDRSNCSDRPCSRTQVLSSPVGVRENTAQMTQDQVAILKAGSGAAQDVGHGDILKLEPNPSESLPADPLFLSLRI
jgi:hypothetical protein